MRHLNSLFADEAVADGRRDSVGLTMNPRDAAAMGIAEGQRVRVTTAHGSVEGHARLSDRMRPGAVTLPHGYADTNVNDLTSAVALDPLTGMPTYSAIPVEVVPA